MCVLAVLVVCVHPCPCICLVDLPVYVHGNPEVDFKCPSYCSQSHFMKQDVTKTGNSLASAYLCAAVLEVYPTTPNCCVVAGDLNSHACTEGISPGAIIPASWQIFN